MSKICVLCSGTWGTAVSRLLADNGHEVRLWSYSNDKSMSLTSTHKHPFLKDIVLPDSILFSSDMQACVMDADLIVMATPSHAVRQTAQALSSVIAPGQIITNISKGIEEGSLMRLSQVVAQEIPNHTIAVMSGPSHAEEVAQGLPTTNVVACNDIKIAQYVQDIFMSPRFRVYTNNDVIGVELGGSLKNVISLCAGIADGLGFGDNTKAALITRGISEITRLGTALGADTTTFAGLSGIGDLIVTCTSMHSRNRRAGILIGQGKTLQQALDEIKMVVEGVKTTIAAHDLAKRHSIEMPIVNEAYSVLFKDKPPLEAVNDLMIRQKRHEEEKIILK